MAQKAKKSITTHPADDVTASLVSALPTSPSKWTFAEIKTDPEFRDVLPELSDDERHRLQERFRRHKEIILLTVWKETGILIDGHHAYEYVNSNPAEFNGAAPEILELSFPDRQAVIDGIILTQLGRRNLSPAVKAELALRLKPLFSAQALQHKRGQICLKRDECDKPIDALAEVAKIAGTSRATTHRVESVLNHGSEELKDAMRTGQTSIGTAAEASKLPKEKQHEVAEAGKASKVNAARVAKRLCEEQRNAGGETHAAGQTAAKGAKRLASKPLAMNAGLRGQVRIACEGVKQLKEGVTQNPADVATLVDDFDDLVAAAQFLQDLVTQVSSHRAVPAEAGSPTASSRPGPRHRRRTEELHDGR